MQDLRIIGVRRRKMIKALLVPIAIMYLVNERWNENKELLKALFLSGTCICIVFCMVMNLPFEKRIPMESQFQNEFEQSIKPNMGKKTIPVLEPVAFEEYLEMQTEENANQMTEEKIMPCKVNYEETEKKEAISKKNMSSEEFLIKSVAYAEGGIDGKEAVKAVMHVINNRVNSDEDFGNTITEVANKSGQFTSVINGRAYIITQKENILITDIPQFVESAYQEVQSEIAKGKDFTKNLLKEEALRQGLTDSKYWKEGAVYFYNPNAPMSESEREARENIKVKVLIGRQYFYCYWG